MNHQDWKPVVIHGKSYKEEKKVVVRELTKEQKLEREELGTHKKVSLTLAQTIQQARIAKGYKTQKEFAQAMNIPTDIVNSYESGRAIPDSTILQKMRRVLGVKL
ncbi:hypothetical protein [Dishui Lake phycodnavirus 4]|nr:hypothetical protein [Dishui Lake phycodnavirus 4]